MAIGEILQELRKDNHLTQKELGKILNVGASTIGGYETGVISISAEAVKILSLYYNVSSDYILEINKDKTSWKDLNKEVQTSHGKITFQQLWNTFENLSLKDKNTFLEVLEALTLKSNYMKNINSNNKKRSHENGNADF